MKLVTVRKDGTRRVQISFPKDESEMRQKLVHGNKMMVKVWPSRSRTKPEFHKDCSMHVIMKKYIRTGLLGDPTQRAGFYGDFENAEDYAEMMRKTTSAQVSFMELPANIRARFRNDPYEMVHFLDDPANDKEAVELNLKSAPIVAEKAPAAKPPAKQAEPPATSKKKESGVT